MVWPFHAIQYANFGECPIVNATLSVLKNHLVIGSFSFSLFFTGTGQFSLFFIGHPIGN